MGQVSNLGHWNELLQKIQSLDKTNCASIIEELTNLFKHLPPHAPPRLQREFESCTIKTEELLGDLFDKIDLSDRRLLCTFLQMLISFGYFRIAQITYHVEEPRDELDCDPIYFPNLEKTKWYDMCPLLPKAGTLGWKGLMNSGMVKDEKEFLQACLQLLMLKLHFLSIIYLSDRFQRSSHVIKRNGEKVAEKLFEMIRDVAHDSDCLIGLDTTLFNLLLPFSKENQLAEVLDAIVQDLFKPFTTQKAAGDQEIAQLYTLIKKDVMIKAQLQDLIFVKLLENLKSNIVRHKRRHSVETISEDGDVTLECLLANVFKGEKLIDLLNGYDSIDVSAKSLQSRFISYWVDIMGRIISESTVTEQSSLRILGTCSIILVTTAGLIDDDLTRDISLLMATTVESTQSSRIFNSLDMQFMVEFTKILSNKTQTLSTYDSPIGQFYKSHLGRYLKHCVLRSAKQEAEKFAQFVNFICDKNLDKTTSHSLQCICIHELTNLLESSKNKINNQLVGAFLDSAKICGKRLYKFIKRNSPLKTDLSRENVDEMDTDYQEDSLNHEELEIKKVIVFNTLVSILRIAVVTSDQGTLDSYSELLLKLYSAATSRVQQLIEITQNGSSGSVSPLDAHLSSLITLYIHHEDLIKGYLNYNLVEKLSHLISSEAPQVNGYIVNESEKDSKKLVYNQIKTKLTALGERAKKSDQVYHTVINKQYSSAVDQSIGSLADIKKEKSCFHAYRNQLKSFSNVSAIILSNCDMGTYKRILKHTLNQLEYCDPLDHPKMLYLLILLESLIPKCRTSATDGTKAGLFKDSLPVISCSLSHITKSVELGPSIHTFTKSGAHKSSKAIQCCTYASCIKIYTSVLLRYPSKTINSFVTDAMQMCVSSNPLQYSKHAIRLHKFFIQLASSISALLKSIGIVGLDANALRSSMPIFLSVFSNLMRCLITASDRQKLEALPSLQMNGYSNSNLQDDSLRLTNASKTYETQLELLATDLAKILNDLSILRVRLYDYAPHLISTYIKDIQRASCPDFVKLKLNEGVFRIFNLVDAHQKERQEGVIEAGIQRKTKAGRASGSLFEMIHARLDQASREIFRDLHDDYNRFHRYQGKI